MTGLRAQRTILCTVVVSGQLFSLSIQKRHGVQIWRLGSCGPRSDGGLFTRLACEASTSDAWRQSRDVAPRPALGGPERERARRGGRAAAKSVSWRSRASSARHQRGWASFVPFLSSSSGRCRGGPRWGRTPMRCVPAMTVTGGGRSLVPRTLAAACLCSEF